MTSEPIIPTCPICHDTGFLHPTDPITEQPIYSKIVICSCRKVRTEGEKQRRLIRICQLPENTEKLNFGTFKSDLEHTGLLEAYETSLRLAEGDMSVTWLSLLGKAGRGKTHLAIAVCRRWIDRGTSARYVYVPLLLDQLREGYNSEQRRNQAGGWWELPYEKQMQTLRDVGLLILDDLGSQVPTAWAMERLGILIDHRYINGLPLMITTNKDLDKLPGDDEGRIASRIRRMVGSRVVTIDAPEYIPE